MELMGQNMAGVINFIQLGRELNRIYLTSVKFSQINSHFVDCNVPIEYLECSMI